MAEPPTHGDGSSPAAGLPADTFARRGECPARGGESLDGGATEFDARCPQPFEFPPFAPTGDRWHNQAASGQPGADGPDGVALRVVVGRAAAACPSAEPGDLVSLDSRVQDPVEVYADGRLLARGELLVLNGNFGVRITELVAPAETASPL